VVPKLQDAVADLNAEFQGQLADLPAAERALGEAMSRLVAGMWENSMTRLQALNGESPEAIIRAGRDLGQAAVLFAPLPEALSAPLRDLAARIPPNLAYARAEVESLRCLLPEDGVTPLFASEATRDALWAALPDATVAHLACHGRFDPETPRDSGLLLARGTRLTLGDLVDADPEHLARLRLAVLSACQTAIIDFHRLPEEVVGLPAGLLQAGVPAVVGTLWPVDDLSTALLMSRFYAFYLRGDPDRGLGPQPVAQALRMAQRWLRDCTNQDMHNYLHVASRQERPPLAWALIDEGLGRTRRALRQGHGNKKPFSSPYFWAPFVCYGAV